ncbi:MAG: phosphoribosylamine--glycine ligase [Eubacteriales bacterium]|jgi:phosphoribosylamine--glycine ligase|nr:phosphoribosylamine--glycine ligase [Eubacteriales bacterium]
MKVLIVGNGGREHALAYKIAQSHKVSKIYCIAGNGGIAKIAECFDDIKYTDIDGVVKFAKEKEVDLVVVAPDDPLVLGMVDELEKNGIRAFGPKKAAAIIEGSKVFSKDLMKKYNIPTAQYEVFDNAADAISYLENKTYPIVIKAEGLALGKGVIIAENFDEAKGAVLSIMEDKVFGSAGNRVVIEQFLKGQEVSVLAFTDGKTIVPMVSAQDHKRVFDGDRGPNTGGMGAFSPSRIYDEKASDYCMKNIFIPTMNAMNSEGRTFKGVLYFGLIVTDDGVYVIEYNCRFGDPEAQVVLPRLKTDIIEIFEAIIDERLSEVDITWDDGAAACVVMASGGYPEKYQTGYKIEGIEEAEKTKNVIVFHSGTKLADDKFYTNGGRVLGVTAKGKDLDEAIKNAYEAVWDISFKDAHYRRDIGIK